MEHYAKGTGTIVLKRESNKEYVELLLSEHFSDIFSLEESRCIEVIFKSTHYDESVILKTLNTIASDVEYGKIEFLGSDGDTWVFCCTNGVWDILESADTSHAFRETRPDHTVDHVKLEHAASYERMLVVALDADDVAEFGENASRFLRACDGTRTVTTPDNRYVIFWWEERKVEEDDRTSDAYAFFREAENIRHSILHVSEDNQVFLDVETEDRWGCDEEFRGLLGVTITPCVWSDPDDPVVEVML